MGSGLATGALGQISADLFHPDSQDAFEQWRHDYGKRLLVVSVVPETIEFAVSLANALNAETGDERWAVRSSHWSRSHLRICHPLVPAFDENSVRHQPFWIEDGWILKNGSRSTIENDTPRILIEREIAGVPIRGETTYVEACPEWAQERNEQLRHARSVLAAELRNGMIASREQLPNEQTELWDMLTPSERCWVLMSSAFDRIDQLTLEAIASAETVRTWREGGLLVGNERDGFALSSRTLALSKDRADLEQAGSRDEIELLERRLAAVLGAVLDERASYAQRHCASHVLEVGATQQLIESVVPRLNSWKRWKAACGGLPGGAGNELCARMGNVRTSTTRTTKTVDDLSSLLHLARIAEVCEPQPGEVLDNHIEHLQAERWWDRTEQWPDGREWRPAFWVDLEGADSGGWLVQQQPGEAGVASPWVVIHPSGAFQTMAESGTNRGTWGSDIKCVEDTDNTATTGTSQTLRYEIGAFSGRLDMLAKKREAVSISRAGFAALLQDEGRSYEDLEDDDRVDGVAVGQLVDNRSDVRILDQNEHEGEYEGVLAAVGSGGGIVPVVWDHDTVWELADGHRNRIWEPRSTGAVVGPPRILHSGVGDNKDVVAFIVQENDELRLSIWPVGDSEPTTQLLSLTDWSGLPDGPKHIDWSMWSADCGVVVVPMQVESESKPEPQPSTHLAWIFEAERPQRSALSPIVSPNSLALRHDGGGAPVLLVRTGKAVIGYAPSASRPGEPLDRWVHVEDLHAKAQPTEDYCLGGRDFADQDGAGNEEVWHLRAHGSLAEGEFKIKTGTQAEPWTEAIPRLVEQRQPKLIILEVCHSSSIAQKLANERNVPVLAFDGEVRQDHALHFVLIFLRRVRRISPLPLTWKHRRVDELVQAFESVRGINELNATNVVLACPVL